jgi:hypothetical protein
MPPFSLSLLFSTNKIFLTSAAGVHLCFHSQSGPKNPNTWRFLHVFCASFSKNTIWWPSQPSIPAHFIIPKRNLIPTYPLTVTSHSLLSPSHSPPLIYFLCL